MIFTKGEEKISNCWALNREAIQPPYFRTGKEGYVVYCGDQKALLKMNTFSFQPGDVVRGSYVGNRQEEASLFSARENSQY